MCKGLIEYIVKPMGLSDLNWPGGKASRIKGSKGTPHAWLDIDKEFTKGLKGLRWAEKSS